MRVEELTDILEKRYGDKYGIMLRPISDKETLEILIEHFLGEYISINPISKEQYNTEVLYKILEMYPERKRLNERIKEFFNNK